MAWDSLLTYTESAVTASKSGSNIEIGPTGIVEGYVEVTSITTSTTADIKIQESEDGTTFTDVLEVPQFSAVGNDSLHFKTDKKYVRYDITIGGASTTPSVDLIVKFR